MSKVGRPVKTVSDIKLSDLAVEYLSTKQDDFGNDISYFKIISPKLKIETFIKHQPGFTCSRLEER